MPAHTPEFTVGVGEEYQIVDRETLEFRAKVEGSTSVRYDFKDFSGGLAERLLHQS
jgi:hypothetical protein